MWVDSWERQLLYGVIANQRAVAKFTPSRAVGFLNKSLGGNVSLLPTWEHEPKMNGGFRPVQVQGSSFGVKDGQSGHYIKM